MPRVGLWLGRERELCRQQVQSNPLKPLPPYIAVTQDPDVLDWLEDDDPQPRARMPCGHVMGREGMTQYAKSTVQEKGLFIFTCPVPNCEQTWDYYLVRHVALFSKDERQAIEERLGKLYLMMGQNVRPCPTCSNFLFRSNEQNRQACPVCPSGGRNTIFCWACLKPWSGSSGSYCGNQGCTGEDPRLRQLREAKSTQIGGRTCPGMRACPRCGALIIHAGGCNRMSCYMTNCRFNFCFFCLREKESGQCTVAPVQTSIPKMN